VSIESIDNGYIVRTAGDVGKMARAFNTAIEAIDFVRWVLEDAPDVSAAGNITFPILPAVTDHDTALHLKPGAKPSTRKQPREPKSPRPETDRYLPTDMFTTGPAPDSMHDATTKRMALAPRVGPNDPTRVLDDRTRIAEPAPDLPFPVTPPPQGDSAAG